MDRARGLVGTLEALAEAVHVMARLRGPGGCPWDAEQTHRTLAKFAIEEAYEVAEAAEAGTPAELQEELGDLLLQVLFHCEIASETGAFDLGDVATTLVDKLRRRHPHVFADAEASTPQEVEANWDAIKRAEKPREHPLEGVPNALPALMRAQKVLSRARKAGLPEVEPPPAVSETKHSEPTTESIGAELLNLVRRAADAQIDAEQALRHATRELEESFDLPPPR